MNELEVSIVDMDGRTLFNQMYGYTNMLELDLEAYERGVYILRLTSKDGSHTEQRIVRM